ncbi:MAG: D-glycero-beta-D-manno-heptose 1-phosphate adenylyltransferase [Deltaproteobacteria bacterium]|jgi:D-beta-D-heptose 7-phosphate kinase/D-beta-D-heptose 1-phosphate adenosyltransferase|nr:D-glycero-beta-D-manno-heptose 1-phosphate adenylyltransferase [Deltaproteobacteria bacterium]
MTDYLTKIMSWPQAVKKRSELKRLVLKFVFTNGCFDLLHPGHLRYLAEARSLGDFLLVGVNADASVSRLKGPDRPVRPTAERAEMLAALVMVDAVTIFEQDTPLELIKALKPDYLVKGGDWSVENIVGASEASSWGGRVKSLSLSPGFSSTALIERIRRSSGV